MQKYIDALVRCGYTREQAYKECVGFLKDFSLLELRWFVESAERNRKNVEAL